MAGQKLFHHHVGISLEPIQLEQKFQLFWKAGKKSVIWHLSNPEKSQLDVGGGAKTARPLTFLPVLVAGSLKSEDAGKRSLIEDFLLVLILEDSSLFWFFF